MARSWSSALPAPSARPWGTLLLVVLVLFATYVAYVSWFQHREQFEEQEEEEEEEEEGEDEDEEEAEAVPPPLPPPPMPVPSPSPPATARCAAKKARAKKVCRKCPAPVSPAATTCKSGCTCTRCSVQRYGMVSQCQPWPGGAGGGTGGPAVAATPAAMVCYNRPYVDRMFASVLHRRPTAPELQRYCSMRSDDEILQAVLADSSRATDAAGMTLPPGELERALGVITAQVAQLNRYVVSVGAAKCVQG